MQTSIHFVLDPDAYQELLDILEREPEDLPRMRELMIKPSPWDED
jgi:uncharacterized protein (DUF1778 family)